MNIAPHLGSAECETSALAGRSPYAVFATEGYVLLRELLNAAHCRRAAEQLAATPRGAAGQRGLLRTRWCRELAAQLRAAPRLKELLEPNVVATQCTYFEKSAQRNWLVPVHQDLSIAVAKRVDAPGLQGWSLKDGVLHVQPPAAVLERLVAVRLHLDDCTELDGPLTVVPRSHQQGRIDESAAARLRDRRGGVTCVAACGDALVMRPLLLHASSKSHGASRRRVLHFVYGPRELPFGLQ